MRLASEMLIHGWQSRACQEAANNISCEPIMGRTTCTLKAACSTSELNEVSSMLRTKESDMGSLACELMVQHMNCKLSTTYTSDAARNIQHD